MATTEARTKWRRNPNSDRNRCYIHGDSVESLRFSHCQSSSSLNSSNLESDQSLQNASKEPHDMIHDYLSQYPSSDLSNNRRWWLNQDQNLASHKDFLRAQQVSFEAELELLGSEFLNKENQIKRGFIEEEKIENHAFQETKLRGLKAIVCEESQKIGSGKDGRDFWVLDDYLMEFESLNSLVSEESKKLGSDFDYQCDKSEPWWRSASKDDLASLVAQKSIGEVENCDLPRPLARNYRKQTSVFSKSNESDERLSMSIDRIAGTVLSNLDSSSERPNSGCESEQTFSSIGAPTTTSNDKLDTETISGDDQSKAQLMRALCLSQKRAREAEKAAEQAYSEKEHIITLLFRQASQLFAYKQWLRLLQLENICLQLKNQNQPICDLIPSVLPWTPGKGREVKKGQHRSGRKRHGKPKHDIAKCAIAFALGLGLASAGLLLGWTMGWLFPTG